MVSWIPVLGWIAWAVIALGAGAFVITSLYERRGRAAGVGLLVFAPILLIFGALLVVDFQGRAWIILALLALGACAAIVLTLPIGRCPHLRITGEQERVDERDAVFHRFMVLEPGTAEYEAYYAAHPEQQRPDDRLRRLPRMAALGTKQYHPLTSPFIAATFDVLERITRDIDWPAEAIEDGPVQASPEEFARRVKGFARYLGADLVGTTRLNAAYIYSHNARGPGEWGAPITSDHEHAVALAVEMKHEMIRHAPRTATTTETAFKYFEAAKIAMILARYINLLGYEARAHVDANYRVMCAPIAADAGLGELGRMGVLVTPQFGPRVRLSVVTTNLPLPQDAPIAFGVQDFCALCMKCASNCPSGSVDSGEKGVYKGVEKWKMDQDPCYRYWRTEGTDCAICVSVCPYAHPDTPVHRLVRWAIRRNALARRLALRADDLFYGRRPDRRYPLPRWHAEDEPRAEGRDAP